MPPVQLYAGGPVEVTRGFVIHSADYRQQDTLEVNKECYVTATVDILESIGTSTNQPEKSKVVLGYAGWDAEQLEAELQETGWLSMPATSALLFDTPHQDIWKTAIAQMGIRPEAFSHVIGHA